MQFLDLASLQYLGDIVEDGDDPRPVGEERRVSWVKTASDEVLVDRVRRAALRAANQVGTASPEALEIGPRARPIHAGDSTKLSPATAARTKLAAPDTLPIPSAWTSARLDASVLLVEHGDFGEARRMATQALTIAEATQDDAGEAQAREMLRRIALCLSTVKDVYPSDQVSLAPMPRIIQSQKSTALPPAIEDLIASAATAPCFQVMDVLKKGGGKEGAVLPNMWGLHMAAAADCCRRALEDPTCKHAPLSAILHCVSGIEAYVNLVTLFLVDLDRTVKYSSMESVIKHYRIDPVTRNALGERLERLLELLLISSEAVNNFSGEVKTLVSLRNLLVHADMRLGASPGPIEPSTNVLLAELSKFVTLGDDTAIWVDRILKPELALWALGVASRLKETFETGYLRLQVQWEPVLQGGHGAPKNTEGSDA